MPENKRPLRAAERKAEAIQRRAAAMAIIEAQRAAPAQAALPRAEPKGITDKELRDAVEAARKTEPKFNQRGLAKVLKAKHTDPAKVDAIRGRIKRALKAPKR